MLVDQFDIEIANSLNILLGGKTILYPTDTVWGIGCDATDEKAVAEIYKVKKRSESKSLIILVDSFNMLKKYIEEMPNSVQTILKNAKKPTTIIYKNPKGLAKNVISVDNTIAIRIVKDEFCKQLIIKFGRPIVSTSANISGTTTPQSFQEISKSILESVGYVVNLHRKKINKTSSSIVKINDDNSIIYIRK